MRLALAAGVLLALSQPIAASQPRLGDWADAITEALSAKPGGRDGATNQDRLEDVRLTLADGAEMVLSWTANPTLILERVQELQARAPTIGGEYDWTTGLNRSVQHIDDQTAVIFEHWADHFGGYRLVMVTTQTLVRAENWLTSFDTYRRAGGFGDWPILTPPQPQNP